MYPSKKMGGVQARPQPVGPRGGMWAYQPTHSRLPGLAQAVMQGTPVGPSGRVPLVVYWPPTQMLEDPSTLNPPPPWSPGTSAVTLGMVACGLQGHLHSQGQRESPVWERRPHPPPPPGGGGAKKRLYPPLPTRVQVGQKKVVCLKLGFNFGPH